MGTIEYTVDQNMTSAISLLHPVAVMNGTPALQSVFVDPEAGAAIAGFRRSVGNLGAVLMRAQYGRNNELEVSERNYVQRKGIINYGKPGEFFETDEGLIGSNLDNGYREAVNNEVTIEKINAVKQVVGSRLVGGFEVGLNPGAIFKFLERTKKESFQDKKVNMQFTSGVPHGLMVATVSHMPDGEVGMATNINVRGKLATFIFSIHESSKIHPSQLDPRVHYLVKPVAIDQRTGRRYVDIVGHYHTGIRMAVQHFNMGILKPASPAYDVNPDKTNGIFAKNIMDFNYIPGQRVDNIKGAPMMTLDLDVLYSLMKVFHAYPIVVMKFKNSTSGVYFSAEGNDRLPHIEAIVGPTIQHVRGKVWLP